MIAPRKSLGQHFLQDANILRKIVESIALKPGETILEIGSGPGALTRPLVESGAHVIAVEVDDRAVALLSETFGSKIDLRHQSVLDVDLAAIAAERRGPIRVAGNIPYNLTSDILFWLIDRRTHVTDATLMVQLEVARRLVSSPGTKEYGILSVFAQFYTECRMLFKVSRNCFFPRPDVDSAIIRLAMRTNVPSVDEQTFRRVVRSTFGQRRKTLRNGLKAGGWTDEALARVSIDLHRRPEQLTIAEFVDLTMMLGTNPQSSINNQQSIINNQ